MLVDAKRIVIALFSLLATHSIGAELIEDQYCIVFGDENAPVVVNEYISFACAHCVEIFQEEFAEIKEQYIDSGDVCWRFCPVPLEETTIRAMICLEALTPSEKKVFFETIWTEMDEINSDLTVAFMKRAMEIFGKPIPQLSDRSFVHAHPVFKKAFEYNSKEGNVKMVPTVEVAGHIYHEEFPDKEFIQNLLGGGAA